MVTRNELLQEIIDSTKNALPTQRVVVKEPEDLQSIDGSKLYFIDGVVDMTGSGISIEVPAGGFNVDGYNFNTSKIICTDPNYTLFTSPVGGSGDILGEDVAFEISGTNSKCFDLTANTGFEAIEWSRCNWDNNTSRGEINGYRQGLESGTGYFGGNPDLILSGTWSGGYFIDASIVRNIDLSMTVPLFRAGAGFTMASRFRSNQNVDLGATIAYTDFAPANFPNASTLQIESSLISRNGAFDADDTTIMPNITKGDLASKWKDNVGLPNTFEGGRSTITVEAATVITVISTPVDVNGTWATSDLEHYDSPASGQLRHLGVSPREFEVVADLVVDSAQNNVIAVNVVKWDNSTSSFSSVFSQRRQINALAGGRDVAFFNIIAKVQLDQNDYVKLQVENQSGTANITVELDSFFEVRAR